MATENYEVLRNGVTIHKDVRQLRNPLTNEPVGYQKGGGKVYLEGEVVEGKDVSVLYKEALADNDHRLHEQVSKMLKVTSDEESKDVAARHKLPFEGYDGMDAADVVNAMKVLPSSTIQRIKEYEAGHENRTEIVDYNIGYGEHPSDRQQAEVELVEPDEDKAVRAGITREVPEDGPVELGEGETGTGTPKKPFGSTKAAEAKSGAKSETRSGRRTRAK